jgi:hypothetical protein
MQTASAPLMSLDVSSTYQTQDNTTTVFIDHQWEKFDQLVRQYELKREVAEQMKEVLSDCEVVLLCDDSDSMCRPIAEEGTDPFAVKRSTRWLELKKLASIIIEIVTAINPNGMDIYFLNRPKIMNVTSPAGLQAAFAMPPTGGTPLIGSLRHIFQDKKNNHRKITLVVVITDGEPTDGPREALFQVLKNKPSNVHVSFAECTDQAEDMEYLDLWDGQIPNFDNTEDYREEMQKVKAIQGVQFKFDYIDYVIKILMATFIRWYFSLDQVRVFDNRNQYNNISARQQYNIIPQQFIPPPTYTVSSSNSNPQMSQQNMQGYSLQYTPPNTQYQQTTNVQPQYYNNPPVQQWQTQLQGGQPYSQQNGKTNCCTLL